MLLFILMVEALGRNIQKDLSTGSLKGLSPSSRSDPITHQQFFDDTILMGESSVYEVRYVKRLIEAYKKASGQWINLPKSQFFSLTFLKLCS